MLGARYSLSFLCNYVIDTRQCVICKMLYHVSHALCLLLEIKRLVINAGQSHPNY